MDFGVAYNISITRAQIPAEFGVSCHGTITPTQAKLLKAQKTGQPHAASCIMLPFLESTAHAISVKHNIAQLRNRVHSQGSVQESLLKSGTDIMENPLVATAWLIDVLTTDLY